MGAEAGGHDRRVNLTIPQSMVDGQVLGADFAISSTFDGPGSNIFDGSRWDRAGVNNFIASKVFWTTEQVAEYFALENEDLPSLSFYSDMSTCAMFGEEHYPTVLDANGVSPGRGAPGRATV